MAKLSWLYQQALAIPAKSLDEDPPTSCHHPWVLWLSRLEMEVSSMRTELLQRSADAARLERDLQVALQARDKAVQARTVAEESEKKALQAATKLVRSKNGPAWGRKVSGHTVGGQPLAVLSINKRNSRQKQHR